MGGIMLVVAKILKCSIGALSLLARSDMWANTTFEGTLRQKAAQRPSTSR